MVADGVFGTEAGAGPSGQGLLPNDGARLTVPSCAVRCGLVVGFDLDFLMPRYRGGVQHLQGDGTAVAVVDVVGAKFSGQASRLTPM